MFLGFDLGGGTPPSFETLYKLVEKPNKLTSIDFHMGVFLGGKHFFNDYFGLRYYGLIHWNISNHHKKARIDLIDINTLTIEDYYNYSSFWGEINFDLLINVYNNEIINLGLFGGVGLGTGAIIGDISASIYNYEELPMRFIIGPNLGLRVVFAKKHGLEFNYNFRALLGDKYFNTSQIYIGMQPTGIIFGKTMPIHNFFFRYAYTF